MDLNRLFQTHDYEAKPDIKLEETKESKCFDK